MNKLKNSIKNFVKSSSFLYNLYYFIFQSIINFLKIFIRKVDKNLILFVVYGGKKYDDSPKFVYEYMKKNYSNKYKYIWAFIEPDKYIDIPENEKIKIDTIKYFITALKAKYWITNSSISRGLNFKNKETKYIVFQHGTLGIKRLGNDITNKKSFKVKKSDKIDMFFIQGSKEKDLLKKAFDLEDETIKELGLPRNDELVDYNQEKVNKIKSKLNIPLDKKVILYAPTFREFNKDAKLNNFIKEPFDFKKMEKELGEDYVMLCTAHYEVAKLLDIPQNSKFVINAFQYPNINDLLLISNILISDYSSIFFDYSILERPMLCFAYDYEEYKEKRGFYIDINKLFSHGVIKSQDELTEIIKNLDYKKECEHSRKIKEQYIAKYGNTTKICTEEIFKE